MSIASGEAPVVAGGSYPTSRMDWRAPVALVLSLLWLGGVGSLIAIVLAVAALRRGTRSSAERTMAYRRDMYRWRRCRARRREFHAPRRSHQLVASAGQRRWHRAVCVAVAQRESLDATVFSFDPCRDECSRRNAHGRVPNAAAGVLRTNPRLARDRIVATSRSADCCGRPGLVHQHPGASRQHGDARLRAFRCPGPVSRGPASALGRLSPKSRTSNWSRCRRTMPARGRFGFGISCRWQSKRSSTPACSEQTALA